MYKKTLLYPLALLAMLASCKKEKAAKTPIASVSSDEQEGPFKKVNIACPAPPQVLGVLTWGSKFNDWAASLSVDRTNNITVQGIFQGTVDFNPGNGVFNLTAPITYPETVYTQRLNPAGAFISAVKNQRLSESMIGRIAYNNYYYVNDIDNAPETDTAQDYKQYLSKYSGNTLVWKRYIGITDYNDRQYVKRRSLATDSKGNIYISKGNGNIYKFNEAGILLDTITHNEPLAQISIDREDNIYIYGIFTGVLQKLSPAGNVIWSVNVQSGVTRKPEITDVAIDRAGNVYASGVFFSTGDFDPGTGVHKLIHSPAANSDMFLQKLNLSGKFVWAVQTVAYGSSDDTAPLDIDFDTSQERIIVAGYFSNKISFGGGTSWIKYSAGSLDAFVMCYQQCR